MMRERLWVKFRLRQSGHLFSLRLRSVVPSRSEIKQQRNETISVFEAFHLRTFLMSRALKRHWNDDQMALEWCWNEIGMTNWDNNGMTAQWCENDFESSLGSVNWSIYFHYSLVSHHPQSTPFSSTTIGQSLVIPFITFFITLSDRFLIT